MRPLSLLTTALAAASSSLGQINAPCKNITQRSEPQRGMVDLPNMFRGETVQAQPSAVASRTDASYSALATRHGKCLDVPAGQFTNGQKLQLWDCTAGSADQQWRVAGNTIRTSGSQCLDLPSGRGWAGAPVQLWACDATNWNQGFEVVGGSIRKRNTNFCIDVVDGHYDNGAALQLWFCDYNSNGNQVFQFGTMTAATVQSPSSFQGYAAISWDRFAQLHPECAPFGEAFKSAAAATNLVPALLGALAMTESTCQERPSNSFGMFQFMNDAAWLKYGGANADRQKGSDAIWGGARYIRALLDQDSQNLDQALRDYNGPVWQGGDPAYQSHIRTWMSGGTV